VHFVIHPAIGVARVGNSEKYYLAPETAGGLPLLEEGGEFRPSHFRDDDEKMRRQAVRFQVFAYESDDGPGIPVQPGTAGVKEIHWTVHVANKKASWYEFRANAGENGYSPDHPLRNAGKKTDEERMSLIIDPGPRTLTEPDRHVSFCRGSQPTGYPIRFPDGPLQPLNQPIDSLGDMWTDSAGRLIFAGGFGISGSPAQKPKIANFANNDDWWDDTSDGPVTAKVIMDDGTIEHPVPAWVTVAPPRYAPQLLSLVTLYDAIFDVSVRSMGFRPSIFHDGLWDTTYKPSWEDDIRPILERAHHYRWVVAVPPKPHRFDWKRLGDPDPALNPYRMYYLDHVRPPDQTNRFASSTSGLPLMPYMCGDNCIAPAFSTTSYMTLTRTQYFYLMQWSRGHFTVDRAPAPSPGDELDRAALQNCSGGAFSPGIEMSWICRNPLIYSMPFRIRMKQRGENDKIGLGSDLHSGLEPGDLTKYQAVPWQADFNECSVEPVKDRFLWWWPVQRPTFVLTGAKRQVPWVGTSADQRASDFVMFADDVDMVKGWSNLGFVFDGGKKGKPHFTEVERIPPRRKFDHPK
jgi:hypothetical protein